MKRTKDNFRYRKLLRCVLSGVCMASLLFSGVMHPTAYTANAAVISVHNYVTDDTISYSGKTVRYKVDGFLLESAPPGLILSNGAAVGPFYEVFSETLGAKTDYVFGRTRFTLSYGPHTIEMSLGNREAIVNGTKCLMNNAPFVYSFGDSNEKHLYVPTRFVAETFGFEYTWNEVASTAIIRRANIIYDGTERIKYSGDTPTFWLQDRPITHKDYPGYILDNTVLFSAEKYIKDTGLASYAYAEGSGLILFKTGDRMVRLVLDSPIAYIDNDAYLLSTVPRLITPPEAAKASVYIPAEFVLKALGYTVNYDLSTEVFQVSGELPEHNSGDSDIPETGESAEQDTIIEILPDTASYGSCLFTYETHEQIKKYFTQQDYRVPEAFSAYSCLNSDALYLKGVDSSNLQITDKADVLELTISDFHNPYNGKVNFNPDAAFLNYCYISGSDSIKIIIIKNKELHYYTYSVPDGCVIHFTDSNGMYEDYLRFTEQNNAFSPDTDTGTDTESNYTDVFEGADLSEYLPDAVFTRDHFVIRLPENIAKGAITDTDEYGKNRFTIAIPGNHISFLSEQDYYNPVSTLKNVQFSYKVANDTTILTFHTTKIQGYQFTVADDFLAVKIADPKEIYDKIIVLDAGHGGIDPGTLRGSVYEKDVNYNVINVYAKEYFKDSDIKVYFTRTTDTKIALETRAAFAATVGADLFISFHVNAHSNSSVNGTGVYYSKSNNTIAESGLRSSILATEIGNRLSSAWGTKNNGILTDKFVVIHNNTVPAVLVECGFITNNKDFEKIKSSSYQKKAAKALYDAVTEIFETYPTKRITR